MLGEDETKALGEGLDEIRESGQKHHNDLQQKLGQFRFLLDSYNRLRDKYEKREEGLRQCNGVQPSKTELQVSKTESRKPFVLVLIDGDGYLFQEHLIRAGDQGGKRAAQLLRKYITEFVQEILGSTGTDCEIMVRVYSNLLELSKTVARTGIVGREARSLSNFASGFSASQGLFDFVDTADSKWRPVDKIKQNLELFADVEQCKHIFMATCHDSAYLPLLAPYSARADVTLIKAASFVSRFTRLELSAKELPFLFMSEPITEKMESSQTIIISPTTVSPPGICRFYQKGNCRYGDDCKNIHTMPWGQEPSDQTVSQANSSNTKWSRTTSRDDAEYATLLPSPSLPLDKIPVNKYGYRLDPYTPHPPSDEWDAYIRHTKVEKLCNTYYLAGSCSSADECTYCHDRLSFDAATCLRYVLRRKKCTKGARCRTLTCVFGHHCQKGGCAGGRLCKFEHGYKLDLDVSRWEEPGGTSTWDVVSETESPVDTHSSEPPVSSEAPTEWRPEPSLMDFDF